MGPKAVALAKKAAAEDANIKKAADNKEKEDAADWSVGAKKGNKKDDAAAAEELKRLKANEKQALLAEEDAELSNIVNKKQPEKKKKGGGLDLLEAALAGAPKSKAQKERDEKERKVKEQKAKDAEAGRLKEEQRKKQQAEKERLKAKGIVSVDSQNDLFRPINNHLSDDEGDGEANDDADTSADAPTLEGLTLSPSAAKLDRLTAGGDPAEQRGLYLEYYSAQLPLLQAASPTLKLSQYKEAIMEAWKVDAGNPLAKQRRLGNTVFAFGDDGEKAVVEEEDDDE